jgi:hypothetical protein
MNSRMCNCGAPRPLKNLLRMAREASLWSFVFLYNLQRRVRSEEFWILGMSRVVPSTQVSKSFEEGTLSFSK